MRRRRPRKSTRAATNGHGRAAPAARTRRAGARKRAARRRTPAKAAFFLHHASNAADHDPKPPVTLNPSPNFASRQGERITTLVIHNTDGPLTPSLRRLKDPAAQVSAHYVVDRDGRIYQLVDDSHTAWHAGNRLVNQRSIGVEIVAWRSALGMTAAQQAALAQLCRFVAGAYGVTRASIVPHRSIKATECPGWVFPTSAEFESWKATHLPE